MASLVHQRQQKENPVARIVSADSGVDQAINNLESDIRSRDVSIRQAREPYVSSGEIFSSEDPELGSMGQLEPYAGVPRVTQTFGQKSPYDVFSGGVNYGVDFGVKSGTPVGLPPGQWRVVEAYNQASGQGYIGNDTNRGYGNSVLVQNEKTGESIRLSHLDKVGVAPGQRIPGGTIIGLSGATGNVTGAHLDVEYRDQSGQLNDVMRTPYARFLVGSAASTNGAGGGNPFSGFSSRVKALAQEIKNDPLRFTPLSMREEVVPMGQDAANITGLEGFNTLARMLRGGLQMTPMQRPGERLQQSSPTTDKERNQESIGRGVVGLGLTAPIGAGSMAAKVGGRAASGLVGGGVVGGTVAKITGGDVEQGVQTGMAQGIQAAPLMAVTNPITNKLMSGATSQVSKRVIGGFTNLLENELFSKLDKSERNLLDRVGSFLIGAVLSGNEEALQALGRKLDQLGATNQQAGKIIDRLGRAHNSAGKYMEKEVKFPSDIQTKNDVNFTVNPNRTRSLIRN